MKRIWVILLVACCCAALIIVGAVFAMKTESLPLPEIKHVYLYYFDGDKTLERYLNEEQTSELARKLSSTIAWVDEDWSAEQAQMPAIGLMINDGMESTYMAYTDGHLICEDGRVYRIKLDLESFVARHNLVAKGKECPIYAMPCMYWLARTENGWNADFMLPAEEPQAPEGIRIELLEWNNEFVSATVTNESAEMWSFGQSFGIHVQLEGIWYVVPPLPGGPVFILSGWGLSPGGQADFGAYVAGYYGVLPPGTYRYVRDGLSLEHTIE